MIPLNWDTVVTAGLLVLIPAVIPTLLDRDAQVPRLTSGCLAAGSAIAAVGLLGLGAFKSVAIELTFAATWTAIFFLRGPRRPPEKAMHGHTVLSGADQEFERRRRTK